MVNREHIVRMRKNGIARLASFGIYAVQLSHKLWTAAKPKIAMWYLQNTADAGKLRTRIHNPYSAADLLALRSTSFSPYIFFSSAFSPGSFQRHGSREERYSGYCVHKKSSKELLVLFWHADCDILISGDQSISRRHATVCVTEDSVSYAVVGGSFLPIFQVIEDTSLHIVSGIPLIRTQYNKLDKLDVPQIKI